MSTRLARRTYRSTVFRLLYARTRDVYDSEVAGSKYQECHLEIQSEKVFEHWRPMFFQDDMIINELRDEEFLKREMDFIRVTMTIARPKLSYRSFVTTKANMCSKSSKLSHYDTLEVKRGSTQGEIKASYFKLSKQYHPDKNKSTEATEKFRNISEAYEVLGNFKSRKIYDRSILTGTEYHGREQAGTPVDKKAQYYRAQRAIFKSRQTSGSTPIYDFDAWTKAHYATTLNRTLKDKQDATLRRNLRVSEQIESDQYDQEAKAFAIFTMIFVVGLLILSLRRTSSNNSALVVNQGKKTLEQQESSDIKSQ